MIERRHLISNLDEVAVLWLLLENHWTLLRITLALDMVMGRLLQKMRILITALLLLLQLLLLLLQLLLLLLLLLLLVKGKLRVVGADHF